MKVPYSYLDKQFNNAEHILDGIRELLQTGQFTLGPAVAEFESRFGRLCQVPYAISVNSGTDALFLAMKALGVGPGDEVITAPNSFIATAGAIAVTGARPVFVDINEEYSINPDLIESVLTPRTKAIVPVHLTGNPADMPKIMKIAEKHNLFVVEDAAQAIGAMINGRPVGSFGNAGCFSLHPLKNLNVWGDGGVILTHFPVLLEQVRLLRNHGLKNRNECQIFGYNSRLDTLQAIVGNCLIEEVESITEARIRNAKMYDEAFRDMPEHITVPPRKKEIRQVFHTYVIQARERDRLSTYLAEQGVETKVHYPIPIHLQNASRDLGYRAGDFPVCEAQARFIVTLPVHQHLTEAEVSYVIDQVRAFYSR